MMPGQSKIADTNAEILEDIAERESLRADDEFDDAQSSLSKELLMAKQNAQQPKQAF